MKKMDFKNLRVDEIEISPMYYLGQALSTLLRALFIIAISFIIVYPIIYMFSMSIRSYKDFYDATIVWIPKTYTFENFKFVLKEMNLGKSMINTVVISVLCTIAQILITSTAAYGFARFRFKGSNFFFALMILSIMIPPQMLSIPNYLLMKNFDFFGIYHLITGVASKIDFLDTIWCFLIPALLGQGLKAGLFILIFRQLYSGLPSELEEAALIDGCGYFKTYYKIMLPNAANAFSICGIFSLVWYWTDYYTASSYTSKMKTMALELSNFRTTVLNCLPSAQKISYRIVPLEQAACLLFILPLIILFIVCQKTLTQGIDKTGIVG